jgi:hypothetical protein
MVRYDILTDPDEKGFLMTVMSCPSALDALRLAWRMWRDPHCHRVLIRVHRTWVERYCSPVMAGRVFEAPLGSKRRVDARL